MEILIHDSRPPKQLKLPQKKPYLDFRESSDGTFFFSDRYRFLNQGSKDSDSVAKLRQSDTLIYVRLQADQHLLLLS